MNRMLQSIAIILVLFAVLALVLIPQLWELEPVVVLRIGLGAAIFLVLLFCAAMLQLILWIAAHYEQIAEQKLSKEKQASDAAHRQFIRRLDHEIKNPLTGLQAGLANLSEAESEQDRKQAGDILQRAVERMIRLLRDLRKLAELEPHHLERRPVEIGLLVSEMIEAVSDLPEYTGRQVSFQISQVPWAPPPITGDRDLLGLAFYNLLINALKFSSFTDAVEVRVREDGHWIIVDFADSGPGIQIGEQPFIYAELYRGANATGVEGSGLGLSLVRRVIELHGGEIVLRSQPDHGGGTVFTVRLPIKT
jgi:two-component system, OmpR family, sensor kinase